MERSESIMKLAEALAKAQGEMANPAFDSTNPHFRSKYASLAAVRNAVIPVTSKYGISVMQPLTTTETGIRCAVILMHSSGETMGFDPMDVPAMKTDAQGLLSAATYAKRATLQAIFCVVGDGDDDGNAAAGKAAPVDNAPPVEVDDKVSATLKAAKTLPELQAAWEAIPAAKRHGYKAAKEEAKERIARGAAA